MFSKKIKSITRHQSRVHPSSSDKSVSLKKTDSLPPDYIEPQETSLILPTPTPVINVTPATVAASAPFPSPLMSTQTLATPIIPQDFMENIPSTELGLNKLGEPIGEGSYSKVYKTTWRGMKVAVKQFKHPEQKDNHDKNDIKAEVAFKMEVNILRSMGNHPNIARAYGANISGINYSLILELLTGGDLYDYLVNHPRKTQSDAAERQKMAVQVIKAAVYLWSVGIIHRDVKSENFLIDSDNNVKLTDFGFAEILPPGASTIEVSNRCGTPGCCAPELINTDRDKKVTLTETHDMYSFAVVIWALASEWYYKPYYDIQLNLANLTDNQLLQCVFAAVSTATPQPICPTTTEECKSVLLRCWSLQPSDRLTPNQVDELFNNGLKLCKDNFEELQKRKHII